MDNEKVNVSFEQAVTGELSEQDYITLLYGVLHQIGLPERVYEGWEPILAGVAAGAIFDMLRQHGIPESRIMLILQSMRVKHG